MKRGPKKINKPRAYTRTAKILRLLGEGFTAKEAAEKAGTSTQSVYCALKSYPHLGRLPGRTKIREPRPGTKAAAVLKLIAEGLSPREAANKAGTAINTVYNAFRGYPHLKPNGCTRPFIRRGDLPAPLVANVSPDDYAALRHMLGFTQEELSRRLGVDLRTVQRREKGEILITNEAVLAVTSLADYR